MPTCPYCKAPLPLMAPKCPTCGQAIQWATPAQAPPPAPPVQSAPPPRSFQSPPARTPPVAPAARPPTASLPPIAPPIAPPHRAPTSFQPAAPPPAKPAAPLPAPAARAPIGNLPPAHLPPVAPPPRAETRFQPAAPPPAKPAAPVQPPPPLASTLSFSTGTDPGSPPPRAAPSAAQPLVAEAFTAAPPSQISRPVPPITDPMGEPAAAREVEMYMRRVAPLWRRLGAWLVDGAVLGGVFVGLLTAAARMVHHGPPSRLGGLDWAAETILSYSKLLAPAGVLFAVLLVIYLGLFTFLGGQTPGKQLLRIQVIDRRGRGPSLVRAIVRTLLAVASAGLVLMGFLLVIFDRRRQALHDKLAGTFVVNQG